MIYKSMIQPILEYGNVIWGPHYVLDQHKLDSVQQHTQQNYQITLGTL